MAWALGVHALTKASKYSCLCSTEKVLCNSRRICSHGVRIAQHYRVSKRWKSSASPLTTNGLQNVDDVGADNKGQKKTLSSISNEHNQNVKILLTEKSSKAGSLESHEAPVLHHAREGAMVDVRRSQPDNSLLSVDDASAHATISNIGHAVVKVQLPVNQLLKDSYKLVQRTKVLKPREDDVEYIEELENQKHTKTELVGALPPGALDWRPQRIKIQKLSSYYAALSKSRLTGLVVITAVAGYAMAPAPLDPLTLLFCSLGTGLTSSAANAINQFFEVPFDAQMDRTKNRALVRGLITPLHAVSFAAVCSTAGVGMLYFGANGVAASLGAVNLVLYTCGYTPMKRLTILNTWVGAVVGAIPPLIGWASCTGDLEAGAWIMAGLLFAWQFPHFNSLSWNLRPDYSRAGYRMMSVTNPGLCRRVALRYSIAMIGLCTLAPVIDVTTWTFAADSLPLNIYLTYLAWRFYKDADSKSSRKLFLFTLIHLPAIMVLMIISKKHYVKKKNETGSTGEVGEKGNTNHVLNSGS